MIDVLRHDDVREQPGRRGPAGNRLGWERPPDDLWVVAGALTTPTRVDRPHDLSDEQGRGLYFDDLTRSDLPLGRTTCRTNRDAGR